MRARGGTDRAPEKGTRVLNLDPDSEFAARAGRHLERDDVAWLVTVDPDGTPQPSPVWFLWDGETALVYSKPQTTKLRNLERSPRASLHFNGDANGGDIVILTGAAAVDPGAPPADAAAAYIAKYTAGLRGIGMTPEAFAAEYSVALRFRPERVRGH